MNHIKVSVCNIIMSYMTSTVTLYHKYIILTGLQLYSEPNATIKWLFHVGNIKTNLHALPQYGDKALFNDDDLSISRTDL